MPIHALNRALFPSLCRSFGQLQQPLHSPQPEDLFRGLARGGRVEEYIKLLKTDWYPKTRLAFGYMHLAVIIITISVVVGEQ